MLLSHDFLGVIHWVHPNTSGGHDPCRLDGRIQEWVGRTLTAIANLAPQMLDDLQGVSGIGAKKLEAYGEDVPQVSLSN